jgi:hypothetical protein
MAFEVCMLTKPVVDPAHMHNAQRAMRAAGPLASPCKREAGREAARRGATAPPHIPQRSHVRHRRRDPTLIAFGDLPLPLQGRGREPR